MKWLVAVVILFPVVFFGALLVVLDNPDLYRDQLANTVKSETGLELQIDGEITWRYWPPIAMDVSDISLHPGGSDEALLELRSASVDLKLLPLIFGGGLAIDGLSIDGLTLNASVDENGRGNWEVGESTTGEPAEQVDSPTADAGIELDIAGIQVSNASISYKDAISASHYTLLLTTLETGPVSYETPTTLNFALTLEDVPGKIRAAVTGKGKLGFNAGFNQYRFDNLAIEALANLPDLGEVAAGMTLNGMADLQLGTVSLTNTAFQLADLQGSTDLQVTELNSTPTLQGKLTLQPFSPKQLLASLHQPAIETANPQALGNASLAADISGTANDINLSNIRGKLDNSTLSGSMGARLTDKLAARFDLNLDQLRLSDYLPPATDEPTATSAAPEDAEVLPITLLSSYDLDGKFAMGQLDYEDYTVRDLTLAVANASQQLQVDVGLSGYEGELKLNFVALMPATGTPTSTTQLTLTGLDITKLTEFEWITGTLDLDSRTTFSGSMLSSVLDSIDGTNQFKIQNGTLDVTPIKGIATTVDSLRGKPSGIGDWPDRMPFEALNGSLTLTDGIEANQQLNVQVETVTIDGKGGIDYWNNTLVYDLGATLQESDTSPFSVNPPLAGLRWPLHCEGAMDASPVDMCRPDSKGVTRLATDLLKQEVKRQGVEKLTDKLPDNVKDTAKSLLKGLFD